MQAKPRIQNSATIININGSPKLALRIGRDKAPIKAPSLPIAALKPWALARMEVGKISAGIKKVVALGPKFINKKLRPNSNVKIAGWAAILLRQAMLK